LIKGCLRESWQRLTLMFPQDVQEQFGKVRDILASVT
jgi:hypothetical protein